MSDEIIRELWRVKDAMAQEHGHDIRRLAAYLRDRTRWELACETSEQAVYEITSDETGQRLFKTTRRVDRDFKDE